MPESSVPQTIYGGGVHEVAVGENAVIFSEDGTTIAMSRNAFREVVLAWHRLLDQEREREDD